MGSVRLANAEVVFRTLSAGLGDRLRRIPDERLQYVDEVLGEAFTRRPADVLVSTNAIHLYDDLDDTLRAWARVLQPGGLDALRGAGFAVGEVSERTIEADVEEWYEFLSAYADAVLGWVGGSVKVDGEAASDQAASDRLELLRRALDVIFGGRPTFRCCWTYISATRT